MKTFVTEAEEYMDLIVAGKKLFLCKGFFGMKEISKKIVKIEVLGVGGRLKMSSMVVRGVLGQCVASLPGAVIGVATAKSQDAIQCMVYLENGPVKTFVVATEDNILINWLMIKKQRLEE